MRSCAPESVTNETAGGIDIRLLSCYTIPINDIRTTESQSEGFAVRYDTVCDAFVQ